MNDPGQWHLYAYCANNPINYVDPSGHVILPAWVNNSLRYKVISAASKTSIRGIVSAGGSAFLAKKGYVVAKALFNHDYGDLVNIQVKKYAI